MWRARWDLLLRCSERIRKRSARRGVCSTSWRQSRRCATRCLRRGSPARRAARLPSTMFRSGTAPRSPRCCTESLSASRPVKSSRWWGRAAPARRLSLRCWRDSGMSPEGESHSTASTSATSRSPIFVAPLESSRRSQLFSAVPSGRTSLTPRSVRTDHVPPKRRSGRPRKPRTRRNSSTDCRTDSIRGSAREE